MKFFSNSTPITDKEIQLAESHFGVRIPDALKELIRSHNGATWNTESGMVDSLVSLSKSDEINVFDFFELPSGYLPFADDGQEGCFALSSHAGECVVHFDNMELGQKKTPIATSFDDFLTLLQTGK